MRKTFAIGQVAKRTGLAVSAIRFYEEAGLISASRDGVGRRRFVPSDIRRLSFIIISQKLGFTLGDIRAHLDSLPKKRTPTDKDWQQISQNFQTEIDQRITTLKRLRNQLSDCIGCGCLSLKKCALSNIDDRAAQLGAGPRYLMGDRPQIEE